MRILYLDINSLRPDHLGCYGYHRPTSPNIDALAKRGLRFANFYTSDAPCRFSQEAFLGGRFGVSAGAGLDPLARVDSVRRHPPVGRLPQQLRAAGLRTALISPFPGGQSPVPSAEGFDEVIVPGGGGLPRANIVWPHVKRWLQAHGAGDSWFLQVNLWDPHTPYDVPLEYGQPFRGYPPPAWIDQPTIDRHRRSYGPHDAVTPCGHTKVFDWPRGCPTIRTTADWKAWIDGYDTGISHADHYVGEILRELERADLLADTAIVVSAAHGENQGELEVYGDHQTADEHTHHAPLIMVWPGMTGSQTGKCWKGFAYNVDLAATFVDLAGGRPVPGWDGESFAPVLRGENFPGREFLVLTQGAWSCQRAVRWKDYLLILTYHTGNKNFPARLLFDLAADPHETRDLVAARPELVQKGLALMERWLEENLRSRAATDPLAGIIAGGGPLYARDAAVGSFAAVLRKTGRTAQAEWVEANPGTPRPG